MPVKLSGLIEQMSKFIDMPVTAIEAYVKPLRKAGLIGSAKRPGPGSPEMLPEDVSWLLLAILAGKTTSVVERVQCYGSLVCDSGGLNIRKKTLSHIGLDEEHTFFDCISRMIGGEYYDRAIKKHIKLFAQYGADISNRKLDDEVTFSEVINMYEFHLGINVCINYPTAYVYGVMIENDSKAVVSQYSIGYAPEDKIRSKGGSEIVYGDFGNEYGYIRSSNEIPVFVLLHLARTLI